MEMLIKEACTIAGEERSSHADIGDQVDVPKDDAILLARLGRALFLNKADDPTKGTLTATSEDKASIKKQVSAIKAAREERDTAAAAQSPAGLAGLVAAAVQAALTANKPAEVAKT